MAATQALTSHSSFRRDLCFFGCALLGAVWVQWHCEAWGPQGTLFCCLAPQALPLLPRRSTLGRRSVLSAVSILVALLIAGQAVTIYYVYQQSGQISKLTKTSQSLKLESLQRRMPTSQ